MKLRDSASLQMHDPLNKLMESVSLQTHDPLNKLMDLNLISPYQVYKERIFYDEKRNDRAVRFI